MLSDRVSSIVQVDRKLIDSIPFNDRGLSYGDGVFESIRLVSGKLTFADLHWKRLLLGIKTLQIRVGIDDVIADTEYFLEQCHLSFGVIKIIVTRGSGGRGYSIEHCSVGRIIIQWCEIPSYPPRVREGVNIRICDLVLGYSSFAGLKHLCRLDQVMARSELTAGRYDEGLLMDDMNFLIEGTMNNLFLLSNDNVIKTPDLIRCGVAGVCRQYILDNAEAWGYQVSIENVDMACLRSAKEVFLTNSINGVWPVISCSSMRWQFGEVTQDISSRVHGVLDG